MNGYSSVNEGKIRQNEKVIFFYFLLSSIFFLFLIIHISFMLATHRRDKILEFLKEDGSAKVLDLAKLFKVTEVTIRQDLEKLDKEGLIVREHGGAFLKNVPNQVKGFTLTHQENMDKKELIAKK